MNKYQRLIVIVAAINALIMILFPPFYSRSLARTTIETFDGYYPLLTTFGFRPIHSALLTLQLMFLAANTLAAWLVLQPKRHHDDIPSFRYAEAIGVFVLIDLALICFFPPFEPYQSLQKGVGGTFDSFYFVFGDRSKRPVYIPLLQLEVMWVIANALVVWLLFNAVRRNDDAARARILALAEALPDAELERISAELKHRVEEHQAHATSPLNAHSDFGRGPDRRQHDPHGYRGPERRSGHDRRDDH